MNMNDNYLDLAEAILQQAHDDYVNALIGLKRDISIIRTRTRRSRKIGGGINKRLKDSFLEHKALITDCRAFYRGEWIKDLAMGAEINPEEVINRCEHEALKRWEEL